MNRSENMIPTASSLEERAELLERCQWVPELSWRQIENLARYLQGAKTARGGTVIREGSRDAFMCIIVEGKVHIIKEDVEGKEKLLSVVNRGQTFGEMSLFDGEPRSASVRAAEDTTMLILTLANLQRLMEEAPILGAKILYKLGRLMSQRLRMTSGKLVDYI
ncbi:MAG: Cyclic AMP receptor-like protein [Syntrophus sp. PtaU1.Bin208]|jgi:CRP-like cAMP-binding protein|nr:MAG: Cyclic AMP receptor-like protein [Syntrophus sp. PtaU1.Bin208]